MAKRRTLSDSVRDAVDGLDTAREEFWNARHSFTSQVEAMVQQNSLLRSQRDKAEAECGDLRREINRLLKALSEDARKQAEHIRQELAELKKASDGNAT